MSLRLLDAGECALVVEFGAARDPASAARVLALDRALSAARLPGVVECVPTYRSLLVQYDPLVLPRADLVSAIAPLLDAGAPLPAPGRRWRLPACYDPALAEDLAAVAAATGLAEAQVTALHAGAVYRVAMFGFAPGWAYLDGLDPRLSVPRRRTPRDRIAAGSLIVAGGQAIVAGPAMPSGWHIMGRTPERMFAPDRDPVFLMAAGDEVVFEAVDRATFEALAARAAAGEVLARVIG